jgi:hypothetical protein
MQQVTPKRLLVEFAHVLQSSLFPALEEEFGTLTPAATLLTKVLAAVPLGPCLPAKAGTGRPCRDRAALAAAFIAKAVCQCATTRQLIERLRVDSVVRRLCGFRPGAPLPSEATFSRAFDEFASAQLPQRLHEALIRTSSADRLIGHISRDSTAIEARERFPERKRMRRPKRKRARARAPKKARASERGTLIQRHRHMSLAQMMSTLSTDCAIGVKTSSKGHQQYWRGYKLHADVADGQIPVSVILTGANVHDATAAIPLMTLSAGRVTWCYDLMDSAYDADAILTHSRQLGHVPIVQPHPRRNRKSNSALPKVFPDKRAPELTWAQQDRFKERTAAERVFARLKDEFGASSIRVRGATKVMAHLGFGILALTVDQLLRLTG